MNNKKPQLTSSNKPLPIIEDKAIKKDSNPAIPSNTNGSTEGIKINLSFFLNKFNLTQIHH